MRLHNDDMEVMPLPTEGVWHCAESRALLQWLTMSQGRSELSAGPLPKHRFPAGKSV
jgi:hypothetical protein